MKRFKNLEILRTISFKEKKIYGSSINTIKKYIYTNLVALLKSILLLLILTILNKWLEEKLWNMIVKFGSNIDNKVEVLNNIYDNEVPNLFKKDNKIIS